MARPQKKGLDYFPFDVDFFADKKIRILKARYGTDGIGVYIFLLCEIYKDNGYYIKLDEDYEFTIQDELNLRENVVKQIMEFLFSRSLFTRILIESDTFITSEAVQRRYQEAVKLRKKTVSVQSGLWILSKEETINCIKVGKNEGFSEINYSNSEKNPNKSEKNATKEKKVKESIGNKSKEKTVTETADIFINLILNDKSFFPVSYSDISRYEELYPAVDIKQELRCICDWLESNPRKRKTRSGIKAFISRWLAKAQNRGGRGFFASNSRTNSAERPSYDISLLEKID